MKVILKANMKVNEIGECSAFSLLKRNGKIYATTPLTLRRCDANADYSRI